MEDWLLNRRLKVLRFYVSDLNNSSAEIYIFLFNIDVYTEPGGGYKQQPAANFQRYKDKREALWGLIK